MNLEEQPPADRAVSAANKNAPAACETVSLSAARGAASLSGSSWRSRS